MEKENLKQVFYTFFQLSFNIHLSDQAHAAKFWAWHLISGTLVKPHQNDQRNNSWKNSGLSVHQPGRAKNWQSLAGVNDPSVLPRLGCHPRAYLFQYFFLKSFFLVLLIPPIILNFFRPNCARQVALALLS